VHGSKKPALRNYLYFGLFRNVLGVFHWAG
jgi:hypothetical protein